MDSLGGSTGQNIANFCINYNIFSSIKTQIRLKKLKKRCLLKSAKTFFPTLQVIELEKLSSSTIMEISAK